MDENSMILIIFAGLKNAWNAVYSWFVSVINATSTRNYIIGAILAMLVIRFLVYPFLKTRVVGVGSDRAKYNGDVVDAEYRRL